VQANDPDNAKSQIKIDVISDIATKWRLINFWSTNGAATSAASAFASHQKRALSLSFATFIIGSKEKHTRVFFYTLALGEPSNG
jgi:hypothetical protein